jgi:hypothetical protein
MSVTRTARPGLASSALALGAFLLLGSAPIAAQAGDQAQTSGQAQPSASDQSPSSGSDAGSDDSMFGSPETVTQANGTSKEAQGQSEFLKYDQVKVGGSFVSKAGFTAAWAHPWQGGESFLDPESNYITPDIQADVTLVAKPLTDFGVDMDFRTSWPFTIPSNTSESSASGVQNIATNSLSASGTGTIPNIAVWSLYSKFNWQDKVYFSVGKQPISWGVSKGAFQPADDIFAVSNSIDLTNTQAEREGPISFKMTVPLNATNNLYFLAGLPTNSDGTTSVSPADARLAVKGEYGFGDTELALGAFYGQNDYPRALLMGTTGIGSWNIFGEGILKYGSQRYFLTQENPALGLAGIIGSQQTDQLYFSGTLGGYYYDSDSRLTVMLQYFYNGEGVTGVSAKDAFLYYYIVKPSQADSIKIGTHYAFASISDTDLFPSAFGADKLGASLIAISNLSDFSGYVIPSISWKFFDYMTLQAGATFSFGASDSEYVTYGVGQPLLSNISSTSTPAQILASLPSDPGVALNITLTIGTGSF